MSSLFNIDRRSAFLLLWFLVFLIGLDLVPETNLLVLVLLSLAYGFAVFVPAYAVLRLLQRGGEGVLAAIALMVAILVVAVVAGSLEYQYRDTRTIPRDIFVGGASYVTGLVWKGGSPAREIASSNVTARIDSGWVRQFIGEVNAMRAKFGVPPLAQNTTLDDFSRLRAHTTIANYGVSHFGRDHDFSCFFLDCVPSSELGHEYYVYNASALGSVLGAGATYQVPATNGYWRLTLSCANCTSRTVYFTSVQAITKYLRLTYGNYTKLGLGLGNVITLGYPAEPTEEILYPYGSPSSYVTFLQQAATAHWGGFLDPSVRSYGFDLEPGVALIPRGQCAVTEIPGPNIDIAQFYTQNGCNFDYGLTEWLVLELGP